MKKEFILTEADTKLLDVMQGLAPSVFQYGSSAVHIAQEQIKAVWNVLGEKHGFDPTEVEPHPDGEPKILAEPKTN